MGTKYSITHEARGPECKITNGENNSDSFTEVDYAILIDTFLNICLNLTNPVKNVTSKSKETKIIFYYL